MHAPTAPTTPSAPDRKRRKPRTPRKPNPQAELQTGKQWEAIKGVPYRTLYELHKAGKLPAVCFSGAQTGVRSGRLYFRRSDIENLIANSLTA
jgi:hypothetical protein